MTAEIPPKIPCNDCSKRATVRFNGKGYCRDCRDELFPMDFEQ